MSAVPTPLPVIQQLRRQLLRCQVTHATQTTVSSGYPGLDKLLPESGLPSGSVIEWVHDGPGLHSATLALHCAAGFLKKPGVLAVVDAQNDFHPMSLHHLGIPMPRLLVVRPCLNHQTCGEPSQAQKSETLWTLEQLARCSGVRVVMAWIDHLSSTAQRRLQLAVEKSGVTVFLMRSSIALQQTSWADLRFHVQSVPQPEADVNEFLTPSKYSRLSVQLVRSKNSVQRHGRVLLDCSHETGDVFEVSELADPAPVAKVAAAKICDG